jgi:hypothetical protein
LKRFWLAPWIVAAVVVLGVSFVAGQALRPEKGAAYSFEASAPAYEAPAATAGVDKAGLSGFGEDDNGRSVISGRVTAVSADSITLQSAGGAVNVVRLTAQAPLRRLEPGDRATLRTGANVIVRLASKDEASSVLVLPGE